MTHSGVASLALGCYLFTSVKPEVRRMHLDDLLEVYLDLFTELTSKMGHPVKFTQEVRNSLAFISKYSFDNTSPINKPICCTYICIDFYSGIP